VSHMITVNCIVLLLCFQNVAVTSIAILDVLRISKSTASKNIERQEAVRLWEQAIAAKGGRARLYAVRNMLVSTRGEYTTRLFKKNQIRQETLYVFPNKVWLWNDLRPDVFGLSVSMYNYDSNMSYVISGGNPQRAPEPIKDTRKNKALRNAQLSFLLETNWLKPTLVKASTGRVGLRSVYIVQTLVEGERVDFAFDQVTRLPVRVSYYDLFESKTYVNSQSFLDYADVGGIKVPQTLEYTGGSKYKANFQFNVEYNENIFVKPPPIEAGPEAWKSAKR